MSDDKRRDCLEANNVDRGKVVKLLGETLSGADDGEMFIEHKQSESLVFDNGRIKAASFDMAEGYGVRVVADEAVGYAHATEVSLESMQRCCEAAASVKRGYSAKAADTPERTNQQRYKQLDPINSPDFAAKSALLSEIDGYLRAKDSRVIQVSASLNGLLQDVEIIRQDGQSFYDSRPLVRLSVSVVVEKDGRRENGMSGGGGRYEYANLLDEVIWKSHADEALRTALVNLDAVAAPAGEMDIVLGAGWPGILLHEAIGHGLEGDFNRKKTSAFTELMGKRVAAPGVTVVDDGTIDDRRGSLSFDDEGTPTQSTTLIEDGILVGLMQDRQNARLMGVKPTGNGRRQSFAHVPMPRMTNTIMRSGDKNREEIIESVENGLYAVSFGGGQVDIVSGKFVFSCTEAYKLENGKIGAPVKGAMIIGHGPDALTKVSMVGDDMELDPGIGTCGKNGQGVPVGVGQPTLRINGLTVGGTATQ